MLQRADIDDAEWTGHKQLRQRRRFVAHLRVHAKLTGGRAVAEPGVEGRLEIDARRYREIARRSDKLRRLEATEMPGEGFLKA
jgi:hypothetical protein